tara:strand:- start:52 stop:411 length:360 start_codon:yes stop_codon:yes gene_type:complete
MTEEEAKKALLSPSHAQHLTITNQDLVLFTDFAAKVKYENFSNSTCEHPEQGTLCIAVVLNSPAERLVLKDTTEKELRSTGLEEMSVSDDRKVPQTVKLGQREGEKVMKTSLMSDVWCG